MAKRQINVHTAFTLRLPSNETWLSTRELRFEPGVQQVDDEVADHSYTQNFIHSDEAEKPAQQRESGSSEPEEKLQEAPAEVDAASDEAEKPAQSRFGRGRANR